MIVNVPFRPMRLLRVAQPFGHCDFIYELKLDGFCALADVDRIGLSSDLVISRNGYEFKQWDSLKTESARSLRCRSAILDGEIACLAPDTRWDLLGRASAAVERQ